jgi:hypothetical protein
MSDNSDADDRLDDLLEALQRIESWADAYPLDIFPEPDWVKVVELLKAGGITLDAVAAAFMRHALESVGKIARDAMGKSAL